jgi:hypothetical protein
MFWPHFLQKAGAKVATPDQACEGRQYGVSKKGNGERIQLQRYLPSFLPSTAGLFFDVNIGHQYSGKPLVMTNTGELGPGYFG